MVTQTLLLVTMMVMVLMMMVVMKVNVISHMDMQCIVPV